MTTHKLIAALIEREGDYTNHPSDTGGPTRWGITEKVARAHGYAGDMRALPQAFAVEVYTNTYINAPGFAKVLAVSEMIGDEMIDTGVNMGTGHPGPWLQRILNVMNQRGKLFPDLKVDGAIGPATISALRIVLAMRGTDGEKIIARGLNCLQGSRYLEITENREANEDFYSGWMLHRVVMP